VIALVCTVLRPGANDLGILDIFTRARLDLAVRQRRARRIAVRSGSERAGKLDPSWDRSVAGLTGQPRRGQGGTVKGQGRRRS
jgi:hypothetical protein